MVYTQERVSTSHIYVTVQYKNVQFVNSISNFGLTINVHKLMMGYYATMNFASTVVTITDSPSLQVPPEVDPGITMVLKESVYLRFEEKL